VPDEYYLFSSDRYVYPCGRVIIAMVADGVN